MLTLPVLRGKFAHRAKTVMRPHSHTSLLNDYFHFKQHEVKCNRVLHTPSAPVSPPLTAIGQFVDTMLKTGRERARLCDVEENHNNASATIFSHERRSVT
jgi:hypothetical protein